MFTQTNTRNTLGSFIVRDQDGSYDNEYNEALVQAERSEALRAATSQAITETLRFTSRVGLKAGKAVLGGVATYLESAGSATRQAS